MDVCDSISFIPLLSSICYIVKQSYHTSLQIAFALGFLPENIIRTIPSSTLFNWKDRGYKHLIELDFAIENNEKIDTLRSIAKSKRLYEISKALVLIAAMYRNLLRSSKDRKQLMLAHKKQIIQTIERLQALIGLRRALQAFDLSSQLYNYWKRSVSCIHPPNFRCRKIFYNQLIPSEVATIRKYLLHPDFLRWPMVSVYYRMLRDRAAFMSLSTFYLYARMLGLSGLHRFRKPKSRKIGIRASRPFEILHVDITEVRINEQQKLYISFIVDNFSRAILGWKASLEKTASLTLDNLKEVIKRFELKDFALMTDDGSENKGVLAEFIASSSLNIRLIKAQIDVSFSNSMVEAINKIFKTYYWPRDFFGFIELARKIIAEMVNDYTFVRPHGSLKGLTPAEALTTNNPEAIVPLDQIRVAAKQRIAENLNSNCNDCQTSTSE